MGFAQHQSFYIRYKWITKSLKHIENDNGNYFNNKDNYLDLSIGKNMFASLKYWIIATKIAEKTSDNSYKLTDFGKIISEYDINCLRNDTISIIHYNIASDESNSESWFWFFNFLRHKTFERQKLINELLPSWVESKGRIISTKSLKKDIECLIQFYTANENYEDPEDTIYSPFAKLNLISESDTNGVKYIHKSKPSISDIGIIALMYVLLDYRDKNEIAMITVENILIEKNLWGRIFNFDKETILEALNMLSLAKYFPITFSRTNNLDTIILPNISANEYLKSIYREEVII